MLHRFWLLLFLVAPFVLLSLLACDTVGRPSTSAPSVTGDRDAFLRACSDRQQAIRDWESQQRDKLAEEWMEGDRGLLQSAAKMEKIEQEARDMRQTLDDNCRAKDDEEWGDQRFPVRPSENWERAR